MSGKPTRVEGSMLKKIVASELQEERDKCNFDKEELTNFFSDQVYRD